MTPVEAFVSLIATVVEQPTEIVNGWLNTYYVLRKIGERDTLDNLIIRCGLEDDHA